MKPLLWLFLKFLPLWILAMAIGFTIAWWQRGREARQQFEKLKTRLTEEKHRTAQATQQALESGESCARLTSEIERLKSASAPMIEEEGATQIDTLHEQLQASHEKIATLEAALAQVDHRKRHLSAGSPAQPHRANPEQTAEDQVHSEERSAVRADPLGVEAFSGENVTEDEALGIIFPERPEQVDDLTEINGVGPVIAGQLNDFGVYRFRQIALWDDSIVEEFSSRLKGFPNRIHRDNWRKQASRLHAIHHRS